MPADSLSLLYRCQRARGGCAHAVGGVGRCPGFSGVHGFAGRDLP